MKSSSSAYPYSRLALGLALAGLLLPGCHRRSSRSDTGGSQILNQVVFDTRQEVGVDGLHPMGLAVVDLDRNGILDVVVGNTGSDRLQTLVGDGMGGFEAAAGHRLEATGSPLEVAGADFNRDGYPDLATLRFLDGKVSVFIGDGAGGHGSQPDLELAGGTNPTAMLAGDFTGDGFDDLVVADSDGSRLVYHLGDGQGGFTPPGGATLTLPGTGQPVALAKADFDNDGVVDLAIADLGRHVVAVRTLLQPGETTVMTASSVAALCPVDVNGDGWMDLAGVSPSEGKLFLMLNSAAGWVAQVQEMKLSGPGTWVRSGDITGDGIADLVVAYLEESALAVLTGDGTGGFKEDQVLPTTGLPWRVELVDLTGDGRLDILASGSQGRAISLYRSVATGGVNGGRSFGAGFQEPFFVVATDLNGDGNADMVVSDRKLGRVTFLVASGSGYESAATWDVGPQAGNLVRGDFNADGLEDIAVALADGVRIFRRGTGQGIDYTLVPDTAQPPFQAGPGPFEVLAADLDLDGIPELITADYGGESVSILKGEPGMTFTALQKVVVTDGPIGLAKGDFNGDSRVDLALSRYHASRLVLLPGKGDGTVDGAVEIPVDAYPNYMRAADFNQDGRTDLVVSNMGGSSITMLLNMDQFTFAVSKVPAGQNPSALLTRDLNNDGLTDILVATVETGDFRVLIGDGQGGFSAIDSFPGVRGAISADLADLDGDGQLDLILGSIYSKRVTAFRNISR